MWPVATLWDSSGVGNSVIADSSVAQPVPGSKEGFSEMLSRGWGSLFVGQEQRVPIIGS